MDIYVPGCPPTAEALMYGFLQLQKKVRERPAGSVLTPVLAGEEDARLPVLVQGIDSSSRLALATRGHGGRLRLQPRVSR